MARPWYPWYSSDYSRATAHLTFIEDAAYRRQLDHYYSTGSLPANAETLLRVCRAITDDEKAAVLKVAAEFFREVDGFLVQERVVEEITKSQYLSGIRSEAGRKGASTTNRKTTASATATASANGPANKPAIAGTTTTTSSKPSSNEEGSAQASPAHLPACPHQEIIKLYGKHLPTLPQPRAWEGQRANNLKARWRWVLTAKKPKGDRYATDAASAVDFFDRFFGYVAASEFLTGRDGKWPGCDLAWLVKAENFAKVIEGKYENRGQA
ncbi:MAG: YdaU family protein [Sulfuritalea sp.]|jgi:uncharacterized protein YdaU (DUF1376 family)|nr:YdaU family protein [Sulfuritalea sp.]